MISEVLLFRKSKGDLVRNLGSIFRIKSDYINKKTNFITISTNSCLKKFQMAYLGNPTSGYSFQL